MAIVEKKDKAGRTRYLVRERDALYRWFPSKTFDTQTEARRYMYSLKCLKDAGKQAATASDRRVKVSEYWQRWSVEFRNKVSKGWKMSQDQMARDYILPILGEKRISEVRPSDIHFLITSVEEKKLAPQTTLHVYNLINKMFRDAVEEYEIIGASPVRKRYRPTVPVRQRAFLTTAESYRLLDVAHDHWAGPAIWVALYAALRISEIQALVWGAVDLLQQQIRIQAAYNKKLRVLQPYPKQTDWGVAPIPDKLAHYLLPRISGKSDKDYVCPNSHGGMLNYDTFTNALEALCEKAGVKRVTPHELRHSSTELYVEAGATAEDIRRLLNHKGLETVLRYMHRTDQRLKAIASRVGGIFIEESRTKPVLQLVK